MEPTESLDVEPERKSIPLYERCWIFKANKNVVPKNNNNKMIKRDIGHVDFNLLKVQHAKFLAKIVEYQQSLPLDRLEPSSVITQVTTDSDNIKNLFVNNEIPYKGNMNLKAIISSTTQKKVASTTTLNSNGPGRLFRGLSRKCKEKGSIASSSFTIEDDKDDKDDDGDFLLPGNGFSKLKIKRDTPLKNGSESKGPIDLLLGDVVSADGEDRQPAVKMKKRKTDSNHSNDAKEIFEEFNAIVKEPIESDFNSSKRIRKKNTLGIGKENINSKNIIEIDNEMTEIDNTQTNVTIATSNQTSKVVCPMCQRYFASDEINQHAFTCQGPQAQTRSQQKSNNSQSTMNVWERACEGLGDHDPISSDDKKDNLEQQGTIKSSSNKLYNPKMDSKPLGSFSNIFKQEKPIGKESIEIRNGNQKKNRLASSKTTGYMNLSTYSANDLLENHAKAVHNGNVKKRPAAKQLRTFGDLNDSSQEMTKCMRCDQYFNDDELKAHTDTCLNISLLA